MNKLLLVGVFLLLEVSASPAAGPSGPTIITDGVTPVVGGAAGSVLTNIGGIVSHAALPLSPSNGGLGAASLTGLLVGNGTSPTTAISPGTGVTTALGGNLNTNGGLSSTGLSLAALASKFNAGVP